MKMNLNLEPGIKAWLNNTIADQAREESFVWISKGYGTSKLPALPGASSEAICDVAYSLAISISRLAGERIAAEICRTIPERVRIETYEVETEYDDEGGCDFSTSARLHVMRDGEWEPLDGQWDEAHPGVEEMVGQWAHNWANLVGKACVDLDNEIDFEPTDEAGQPRAVAALVSE